MGASTALTLQMLLKGERVLENQDVWARLKGRYDSPICGKSLHIWTRTNVNMHVVSTSEDPHREKL